MGELERRRLLLLRRRLLLLLQMKYLLRLLLLRQLCGASGTGSDNCFQLSLSPLLLHRRQPSPQHLKDVLAPVDRPLDVLDVLIMLICSEVQALLEALYHLGRPKLVEMQRGGEVTQMFALTSLY